MLDGRVLEASQVEYKPFGKPPLQRELGGWYVRHTTFSERYTPACTREFELKGISFHFKFPGGMSDIQRGLGELC